MPTATANPDDGRRAVLFARLPERLDDAQRRRKYDDPLASMIRDAGIGAVLRGFSHMGDRGQIAWVGIEVTLHRMQDAALIAERLVGLGAPPETRIEIERDGGSLESSLAEATGG